MISLLQMKFRSLLVLLSKVWTCICFIFNRQVRAVINLLCDSFMRIVGVEVNGFKSKNDLGPHMQPKYFASLNDRIIWNGIEYQPVKYELFPLSPVSRHRLSLVQRKMLVLDLDETLIHSHHNAMPRHTVKPGTPHDFTVKVTIDRHPVRFFVHKRPHVDYFLDVVSQWYDLIVFTASMEIYGAAVADKLDNGRQILRRRYYRQHCTPDFGSYTKDLSAICNDLNRITLPEHIVVFPTMLYPLKVGFPIQWTRRYYRCFQCWMRLGLQTMCVPFCPETCTCIVCGSSLKLRQNGAVTHKRILFFNIRRPLSTNIASVGNVRYMECVKNLQKSIVKWINLN